MVAVGADGLRLKSEHRLLPQGEEHPTASPAHPAATVNHVVRLIVGPSPAGLPP